MEISDKILKVVKGKSVVFLENGDCLDELGGKLASLFKLNNIHFDCIFDIENLGLEETLRRCRDIEVLIFHTTWVYPVSTQLKKAFMSIKNKEFKKTFIELYIYEPTFSKKPKVIHDIYILDCYEENSNDWEFHRLKKDVFYWE